VYISATQLIGLLHHFDTDLHAAGVKERHGVDEAYIKDKWHRKSSNANLMGHDFHTLMETLSYAAGLEKQREKYVKVQNSERIGEIHMDYWYWPDGVYNELLLWNDGLRVAGKADKVILWTDLKTGRRWADIEDFKTNERIRRRSYYDRVLLTYEMLHHPLSHLMNCEYDRYSLQLSIYQLLLELMGFEPGSRTLLHYPPLPDGMEDFPGERSPKPTVYKLPYLRDEVITLIHWYAQETQRSDTV